jgi:hypothetical protein
MSVPIVNYAGLEESLDSAEAAVGEVGLSSEDEVFQTRLRAAIAHVQVELKRATKHRDIMVAPSDRLTARFQSLIAEYARAEGKVAPLPPGGEEVKFDKHDWFGWVRAFGPEWLRLHPRHGFRRPRFIEDIPNKLRLALFGDWGTGLYGAPHVSTTIESTPGGFDYIVHLGDVYYAGTDQEFATNFIDAWPKSNGIGRALNGNHEMYFGGGAYFEHGLSYLGQPSSVFALQNSDWLIVGLDSAYDDFDLGQGQVRWLTELSKAAGPRKLIVLTHHQLFSNTSKTQGTKLQHRMTTLLNEQRIHAWYWGHEHTCALYEPHIKWGLRGRCIGHAGMPAFREKYAGHPERQSGDIAFYRLEGLGENPSCLVLDGPNPFIGEHADRYAPHGFLGLELHGPILREILYDASGKVLLTQEFE